MKYEITNALSACDNWFFDICWDQKLKYEYESHAHLGPVCYIICIAQALNSSYWEEKARKKLKR